MLFRSHKFRLNFRDAEYNYQDAALASLFVACKVEDTIKKSKDILAASYNVRNPDKPTASDDKVPPLQLSPSQLDKQETANSCPSRHLISLAKSSSV